MKFRSLLISALAVAMLHVPAALHAQAPGTRPVTGRIFRDPNFNGRIDANEKSAASGMVFLYRINPNGSRVKIRQLRSNQAGAYKFANVPFGLYFTSVRYGNSKFGVRGRPFRIGARTRTAVRNFPVITPATAKRYNLFTPTSNAGGLNTPPNVSPSAP